MNKFGAPKVDDAIARLSRQRNESIERVLVNARLVQACQDELRMRGSLNLSTEDAEQTF
jgi:hypothetical protein